MSETTIRLLEPADRPLLDRVAEDVFDAPIDPRWTEEFLRDPRHHMAVALVDDEIVAMASAVHYVHPDKGPELWINEVGVAGSTGRGEAVIVTNGGHRVVGYMADGKSPTDACLAALRDVVRYTKVKRLLREDGKPDFQVKFYAVNKAGEIGAAALYPTSYARATEAGAELADAAALFEA